MNRECTDGGELARCGEHRRPAKEASWVTYSAGKTKGESAGVAKGEEKMRSDLREPVERVEARAEEIRRVLVTSLACAPGERTCACRVLQPPPGPSPAATKGDGSRWSSMSSMTSALRWPGSIS